MCIGLTTVRTLAFCLKSPKVKSKRKKSDRKHKAMSTPVLKLAGNAGDALPARYAGSKRASLAPFCPPRNVMMKCLFTFLMSCSQFASQRGSAAARFLTRGCLQTIQGSHGKLSKDASIACAGAAGVGGMSSVCSLRHVPLD